MKTKLFFFTLLSAFLFISKVKAQSTDEEAVKKVAHSETVSYYHKDSAAWKALYVQDDKVSTTYVSYAGYSYYKGWMNFGVPVLQSMNKYPKPTLYTDFKTDNYIVRLNGNMASVEYDQSIIFSDSTGPDTYNSHELRTMIKDKGEWKITSVTAIDTGFNSSSPRIIEDRLNATGYLLLNAGKTKDAIEVFKTNVKLFPNSWNVYDSLGEGFADDGDKADAIANYEMSLKINPQNDNGKQVLEKLKR